MTDLKITPTIWFLFNRYDPILTYGRVKHPPVAPFRPHYVIYDKKVLKFMGFFKQCCADSPKEYYRIRYVNIFYFLEDDSLTVIETPHVSTENGRFN